MDRLLEFVLVVPAPELGTYLRNIRCRKFNQGLQDIGVISEGSI